jgi:acylphosphatase
MMETIIVTKSVRIEGRVQGVGYRAWVGRQAERLGLRGWVRNCSDGSVEALLHGNQRLIQELLALATQGPPAANVTSVKVKDADGFDEAEGFRVLRSVD